jgi:hypothetical protein
MLARSAAPDAVTARTGYTPTFVALDPTPTESHGNMPRAASPHPRSVALALILAAFPPLCAGAQPPAPPRSQAGFPAVGGVT